MRHAMRVWMVGLSMAVALPLGAQTQITTAVIQGVVTDSTGAVTPGVTVEAVNVETNLTLSRVTDGDGRFVFLQLPPGRYRVTFTLAGFGTRHTTSDTLSPTRGIGAARRWIFDEFRRISAECSPIPAVKTSASMPPSTAVSTPRA